MKYTASLPPKYRLEITVRTSDTEIFISISRDGREIDTIEDNPNLEAIRYSYNLLDKVKAAARERYEFIDAYDRIKTGGSIDIERAVYEAGLEAADQLRQIISDGAAARGVPYTEEKTLEAWKVINHANGYRDEQQRKKAKREKLLAEARALYAEIDAWNSEADQTARARRLEAEARAKEMQAWSL